MGVTVVIPCHNHGGTVVRAITSAYRQCDEVVVTLDNCPQSIIARLSTVIADNVTIISGANLVRSGVCYTRNLAVSLAENELIVPLDADDELLPGAIAALSGAYEPNSFVYGGWIDDHNQQFSPSPINMITKKNIVQSTWLFAKADWLAAGGYAPEFEAGYEDWAFMLSLLEAQRTPIQIDFSVVKHYYKDGDRSKGAKQNGEMLVRMMRRKYPGVFHRVGAGWKPRGMGAKS